jgi:hypothetical protein
MTKPREEQLLQRFLRSQGTTFGLSNTLSATLESLSINKSQKEKLSNHLNFQNPMFSPLSTQQTHVRFIPIVLQPPTHAYNIFPLNRVFSTKLGC